VIGSRLHSQVAAPDLRCLEVLPNGNVKLSWIPPADPANTFFSYEIFVSISATGPFTPAGTISALGLTSYTHTGAGANVQSRYYYMYTTYGSGGVNKSGNSDTLRTIFLNIIPSTPDLKLQYNPLRLPKLPTTASTYTLNKEYPAGIWSILGITSSQNYADTLSVCSASINYQVQINDASGCVSASNVQGGVFNDKKDPDVPVIDSISVLPNGQTILAWSVPRDPDVVMYQIYQYTGSNAPIDTVYGGNSTSYTFTGTAATSSALALYVAAIDSCNRIGSFSITPTTMFLKTSYDKCGYRTLLSWNAYPGMKGGLLEYRIYYSVNNGVFLKVGQTTGTSFTHENVAPAASICYFVRAVNIPQTITASSNRSCFFSSEVSAAGFIYMRAASVTGSLNTQVDLFLDTSRISSSIDIQRSADGFVFNTIGTIPVNNQPFYSFVDDQAETGLRAYYYRAIVRDSCSNSRTVSNVSKTMLLKVTEDKEQIFTRHLSWNAYSGFNAGVSGYNIYRVVNDQVPSTPSAFGGAIDTLYTDVLEEEAANGSKIYYLVEAVEGIGNIYSFMESSRSNTVQVYQEGKIFIPTAFAPRGKNKSWLPITHFIDKSEYSVTVFNRWGNKVFETTDDKKAWDGNDAIPDVYVYLIRYKNSRGEYKEEKGTVLLLE
jgi:hypothetical protein